MHHEKNLSHQGRQKQSGCLQHSRNNDVWYLPYWCQQERKALFSASRPASSSSPEESLAKPVAAAVRQPFAKITVWEQQQQQQHESMPERVQAPAHKQLLVKHALMEQPKQKESVMEKLQAPASRQPHVNAAMWEQPKQEETVVRDRVQVQAKKQPLAKVKLKDIAVM